MAGGGFVGQHSSKHRKIDKQNAFSKVSITVQLYDPSLKIIFAVRYQGEMDLYN